MNSPYYEHLVLKPPRIGIVTQARTGSTRLPGKVLRPILGKPMLHYHLERLKLVRLVSEYIVATTTSPADDAIADLAQSANFKVVRGNEDDVLSRFCDAIRQFNLDIVIRVTSDCPLIDYALIEHLLEEFLLAREGLILRHETPKYFRLVGYPAGMDVEIIWGESLLIAEKEAKLDYQREHVTPFLYQQPNRFICAQLDGKLSPPVLNCRLTVDEEEDFQLITNLLTELYPLFGHTYRLSHIIQILLLHPNWSYINKHIKQKKVPSLPPKTLK